MKFALFILASWAEKDTNVQSRIYGEALEQIQYAEEVGFDSVWIAEHHSSRYGIFPSLMPILTYVAARTKTIRIGGGVSVLPFYNPILLAEEAAMLDLLSNGRLDFGVGRGSADYEYGNFKIDFESRDTRLREVSVLVVGGASLDCRTSLQQVRHLPFVDAHPNLCCCAHQNHPYRRRCKRPAVP